MQAILPDGQHQRSSDDYDEQGQVSEEVGDQGTHTAVQAEVIDEVETKSTADVVELVQETDIVYIWYQIYMQKIFLYCDLQMAEFC